MKDFTSFETSQLLNLNGGVFIDGRQQGFHFSLHMSSYGRGHTSHAL
jgi:hypothetical protein